MKRRALVGIGTLAHMGGAERQALYLVEHLAKSPDFEVEVLTFTDGPAVRKPLDDLGVRVHVLPYYERWPAKKRLMSLARMAWHIRRRIQPDALLPFGTPTSKAMALIWPYTGAKFCWWNQQDEGRGIYGTKTERRILNAVTTITSNCQIGREFLSETFGIDPERIHVYNNGTPLPELSLVRNEWRTKLGISDGLLVTMVANITSFKDHPTLIKAWAKVNQQFRGRPKPTLLLAGNLSESSRVAAIKSLAFEVGLSAQDVRFLGSVSDIPGLLSESDLLVHSSLTEGCPNAVCEAMAVSRAVVATDISGCRQALGPDGFRWLAEPKNADSLADLIIRLLEDDKLRYEVGEKNRRRIESDFSIEGMNTYLYQQLSCDELL